MIVLGARGRKAIKRFLLGSVSQKVLVHAPCSVLIVR
jgi:nucleotide-binding universal stress UspA family protein